MLDQIWTFILEQLKSNQFLSGGFVLGALSGILYALKAIPGKIWDKIKSQFLISVEVPDTDETFRWLINWLAEHPYSKRRARALAAVTTREGEDNTPLIRLYPAKGSHWFFYSRRLVFLHRGKDDGGSAGDNNSIKKAMLPETITITVVARKRDIIKKLLAEAQELALPKGEPRTSIMVGRWGQWSTKKSIRPRPLSSLVLRQGLVEEIISRIEQFRASEDWYHQLGIPHRLGILLLGPPGSGKSSTIAAISAHFKMDLAILNLAAGDLGDENLCNLMSDVPKNTQVLAEDVDCVFEQRESTEDNDSKVTFSGLLNAIDGVAAGEGRIFWMTTNHPEKLDPALIRPGRADVKYELGAPDLGQVCRMFSRFFPHATNSQVLRFVEGVGDPSKISMAALQGVLIRYRDNPQSAIRHAYEAQPEKQIIK